MAFSLAGMALVGCAQAPTQVQPMGSAAATSTVGSTSSASDTTMDPPDSSSITGGADSSTTTGQGATAGLDTAASTTGPVETCGNGVVDEGEQCDGDTEITCQEEGFDDGTVSCTPMTCTIDTSECYRAEDLQNDVGNCLSYEIGCANDAGNWGNPQDLVECFTSTLSPPLEVTSVEYLLVDETPPLPSALDLVVHQWDGPGNLPGPLIRSVPLEPADIVPDAHTLVLPEPIEVKASSFCVGFHGADPSEGFRVHYTDQVGVGESYFNAASTCGGFGFVEVSSFWSDGNYCIRPTVISFAR